MSFKDSVLFRNLSLSIIPITYGILYSVYAINTDVQLLLFFAILLSIIHIIEIVYYCIHDYKNEERLKPIKVYQKKLAAAEELFNDTETIVANNADFLYDLVHNIKNHSEVKDLYFLQSKADVICNNVFKYIKATAEKGKYYAVSIMFMERTTGEDGSIAKKYQMVGRFTNYKKSSPKTLRKFVSEDEANGSYYHTIFNSTRRIPYILENKAKIKEVFKDYKELDYSQYIGIPIFCKDKIVAVLQIVAYNDSVIAKSKKDIQLLCDNDLTLYANLFLLSDKIENIKQLIQ